MLLLQVGHGTDGSFALHVVDQELKWYELRLCSEHKMKIKMENKRKPNPLLLNL